MAVKTDIKINHHTGVLYDTIYYNVIFFNQDRVRSQFKVFAEKEEDIFFFYDEMRSSKHHIDPPEKFYPFFYHAVRCPCVMTEYFQIYFDFFTGTATSFFKLFDNNELFKRYCFHFFLGQYADKINIEAAIKGDKKEISKALIALRHHGEQADTFIDFFYDFEELAQELIKYLRQLHQKINLFHGKRKGLYQEAIELFCSGDNINILKKSYNISDKVKLPKQIFSVSFLNRYAFLYRYTKDELNYSFVIGHGSHVVVPRFVNYKHLTPVTAGLIYSSELINKIVQALRKKELTITQLSMMFPASRYTVDRLIGILYNDFVIQISQKIGNEKYYKLNPEYFLAIKSVIDQDIDDILLDFET